MSIYLRGAQIQERERERKMTHGIRIFYSKRRHFIIPPSILSAENYICQEWKLFSKAILTFDTYVRFTDKRIITFRKHRKMKILLQRRLLGSALLSSSKRRTTRRSYRRVYLIVRGRMNVLYPRVVILVVFYAAALTIAVVEKGSSCSERRG